MICLQHSSYIGKLIALFYKPFQQCIEMNKNVLRFIRYVVRTQRSHRFEVVQKIILKFNISCFISCNTKLYATKLLWYFLDFCTFAFLDFYFHFVVSIFSWRLKFQSQINPITVYTNCLQAVSM